MKNKKLIVFATTALMAVGVVTVAATSNSLFSNVVAEECEHSGYHYAAKAATCTEAGNKEFWACCECHEKFLTEPATGTWTTRTLSETLDSTHIAYVAPVDCEYVPSTTVIGHYVCKNCGKEGTQVMTADDIELGVGCYGSNAWAVNPSNCDATNNGIAREGAIMFDCNKKGEAGLALPKVNYNLYQTVGFECGIDHYCADSLSVKFDLGTEELASWDLIKGADANNKYQYFITVYNEGTSLKVEFKRPGLTGLKNSVTVTDADIMSGAKALTLSPTSATGRTLYVNNITLVEKDAYRFNASSLSKGSRSVLDPVDYTGTVGGVTSTFKKAELAESTGSYSKVELSYAPVTYSDAVKTIAVRLYVECESTSETTSTMIFSDYVNTQYSSGNSEWCIKNISIKNNQWYTISIPSTRLAHDGTLDTIWFYANGAKAARTYYVEYVSLYGDVAPLKTVGYGSIVNAGYNNCGGTAGNNSGNSFGATTMTTASENHGYDGNALKIGISSQTTYCLNRFELSAPVAIGFVSSITFRLYIETSAEATKDTAFILFADYGTTNQQQTVTAANHNKWVDVTFTNGYNYTAYAGMNYGYLDHFNFGVWGTSSFTANSTDGIIIASITFNA